MGRRTTTIAVGIGALVMVGFLVLLATSESGRRSSANFEIVGQVAPPVTGQTLDGTDYDLADHRGQWVVVNFFASWCVGCRVEHPELVEFSRRHSGSGESRPDAEIIAVAFGDSEADAQRFFAELGGDWPALVDAVQVNTVALDYGVTGVPETLLISPAGRVIAKWVGATGVTADGIDAAIAQATGQS